MGKVATSSSEPLSCEASNYDEVFMQQSLLFDDSLKDLKNLRTQLYSAAEYFELSYTNDDQNQIVAETLKDYTVKALVNTVDHLGSVTYKVNDLLDEKVVEVSGTELRVSCIEQRMRTCQEYMDHQGRVQQSLVISTPKYHKRYILPVGETMHGPSRPKSKYVGCSLAVDDEDWHHFKSAVRATIREVPTSAPRKGRSPSPSLQTQRPGYFSTTSTFPKRDSEKRTVSPHRFPLFRSGSLSSRPTTPKSSRPTTPNKSRPTTPTPSIERRWYPSDPRKSASMRLSAERDTDRGRGGDVEQNPSKGKRFLKALLSKRKSKKDEMLYTYLDEY
ncbi:protein ABIL2-like isoform X2 [Prosopis cineraria]|uniref:protein ABIL2-like isoform X2 n=1 Tax=Prosopis cineraria TaxID=364024 RepID=UPI00241029E5|nr:protein ABIL2-like isoform X2 [Prosopis cineraria]